jgi:hypothetical protein
VDLALAQQALADAAASTDSAQHLVDEATSLAAQVPFSIICRGAAWPLRSLLDHHAVAWAVCSSHRL